MGDHKKVILGVSGGIAAYKACELASLLSKQNLAVLTVLTAHAEQFVTPLSFKTLTKQEVYTDQFSYAEVEPLHIRLAQEAELLILVPATANLIAKLAQGICDDLLTTLACVFGGRGSGKILIAPAMNTQMWDNPILQDNLKRLQDKLPVQIIPPVAGELACRTHGMGKLAPVEQIQEEVLAALHSLESRRDSLKGCKVLITAGGTREPIDPVRFISNRSSGKMGIALADEAYARGAQVILISTTALQRDYKVVNVETAREMQLAVEEYFDTCQFLVMAAAVSDYTPIQFSASKLKKSSESDLNLVLTKSPDILGTLGRIKKEGQVLIGFAAESENLLDNARAKLQNKKIDLIIANQINKVGIGFASDHNEVYLLSQDQELFLAKTTKKEIAVKFWDHIEQKFPSGKTCAVTS